MRLDGLGGWEWIILLILCFGGGLVGLVGLFVWAVKTISKGRRD